MTAIEEVIMALLTMRWGERVQVRRGVKEATNIEALKMVRNV